MLQMTGAANEGEQELAAAGLVCSQVLEQLPLAENCCASINHLIPAFQTRVCDAVLVSSNKSG